MSTMAAAAASVVAAAASVAAVAAASAAWAAKATTVVADARSMILRLRMLVSFTVPGRTSIRTNGGLNVSGYYLSVPNVHLAGN